MRQEFESPNIKTGSSFCSSTFFSGAGKTGQNRGGRYCQCGSKSSRVAGTWDINNGIWGIKVRKNRIINNVIVDLKSNKTMYMVLLDFFTCVFNGNT